MRSKFDKVDAICVKSYLPTNENDLEKLSPFTKDRLADKLKTIRKGFRKSIDT